MFSIVFFQVFGRVFLGFRGLPFLGYGEALILFERLKLGCL